MNLFYQPGLQQGADFLDGDEAHHAKVLRLSAGDRIMVTDGQGVMAEATITGGPQFEVTKIKQQSRRHSINLFVAPTKNADRIEWLVEKATEIGVSSITMMQCQRSERSRMNMDRLTKLTVSAMKQSQQAWLPQVKDLTPFTHIVQQKFDQRFIAFVDHSNPDHLKNLAKAGKSCGLLIGPEGDFTEQEVDLAIANGWVKVSLGPTRLRTETAALTAMVLLNNLEP